MVWFLWFRLNSDSPSITLANHLGFSDSLVIRTCLSAGPITLTKLFKFLYSFQAVCTISNQFLTRVENHVFLSDVHSRFYSTFPTVLDHWGRTRIVVNSFWQSLPRAPVSFIKISAGKWNWWMFWDYNQNIEFFRDFVFGFHGEISYRNEIFLWRFR